MDNVGKAYLVTLNNLEKVVIYAYSANDALFQAELNANGKKWWKRKIYVVKVEPRTRTI